MGDKDFPPPTERGGIGQWLSDLLPGKKRTEMGKAEMVYLQAKPHLPETATLSTKSITKSPSFFQRLDFLHIFHTPEKQALQPEIQALHWFQEQYEANPMDANGRPIYSQAMRQLYASDEFQALADELREGLHAAKGNERKIRDTAAAIPEKLAGRGEIGADDLVPMTILLFLKANDPALIKREFLNQLQTIIGESRYKHLESVNAKDYDGCIRAFKKCGLHEAARQMQEYKRTNDSKGAAALLAEEKDFAGGMKGYAIVTMIGAVKTFQDRALAFNPTEISKKAVVSSFLNRFDFLHVFHLQTDVEVTHVKDYDLTIVEKAKEGQSNEAQIAAFSSDALAIARSEAFQIAAANLQNVSLESFHDRKACVRYLFEQVFMLVPLEHEFRSKLQTELLRLLLVKSHNPLLLSASFHDCLTKDALRLPDAESDRAISYKNLCGIIRDQREQLALSRVLDRKANYTIQTLMGLNTFTRTLRASPELRRFAEEIANIKGNYGSQLADIHKRFLEHVGALSEEDRKQAFQLLFSAVRNPHVFSSEFQEQLKKYKTETALQPMLQDIEPAIAFFRLG